MSDQEKKTTEKEQQGKERTGHAKSTQKKRRPNPEHPSTVEHKKKKTTGTAQKEPARKKRTADHETRKAVGEEHKKTYPSGGKKHKAPVEISEPVKWDLDDSGISVSDDLGEERTETKDKEKGQSLEKSWNRTGMCGRSDRTDLSGRMCILLQPFLLWNGDQ